VAALAASAVCVDSFAISQFFLPLSGVSCSFALLKAGALAGSRMINTC
jgi:hypothetical protein